MKIHHILTYICLHYIGCLCYCCYAKTSSSAVQKRHSKVYGNPIAPSFYSILLENNYERNNENFHILVYIRRVLQIVGDVQLTVDQGKFKFEPARPLVLATETRGKNQPDPLYWPQRRVARTGSTPSFSSSILTLKGPPDYLQYPAYHQRDGKRFCVRSKSKLSLLPFFCYREEILIKQLFLKWRLKVTHFFQMLNIFFQNPIKKIF